jgi:ribosomal protein S18 acetylase RimI-like enzyme
MEARIREAVPADAAAVAALVGAVAAENRWLRTETPFNAELRAKRLAELMTNGSLVVFVAESSAGIVGELSLHFRDGRSSFGIAVAAGARRQGVGRKLVRLALERARERNASSVVIEVYAHNVAALELYRSAGFVETGPAVSEARGDGQRWEAVPMSIDLT